VLRSLTDEAAKTFVHAFISSRLDYYNSLLYGVSNSLIRKVQSIQNAASHRNQTTRTYLASAAPVALASCPETYWLQIGMLCLLVSRLVMRIRTWLMIYIWFLKDPDGGYAPQPTDRVLFTHTQHTWW